MEVKALQQMLTQFRQMQENLQKQVESVHVEASAGGGMVVVQMNGQKMITSVRIEPDEEFERDHSGSCRNENPRTFLNCSVTQFTSLPSKRARAGVRAKAAAHA
jgi:hypothetical protein